MAVATLGAFLGAVGIVFGLDLTEALEIAGITGGAAVATGLGGALVLRLVRGTSIARQAGVVSLTSVAAVAAGVAAVSSAMFLSANRGAALATVLIVGGTIGVLIVLVLGVTVDADRRSLVGATRQIAEGKHHPTIAEPGPEDFATSARELEALSTQLEEAETLERAVDGTRRDLVAWISHDLRTPLARIRAVVEALDDGIVEDRETVRVYYRTLDIEATRLSGLIDDLLELSRINSGTLRLERQWISVADVVSDVVASASPLAKGLGLALELRLEARPHLSLSITHIERALGNLLDNAVRHTPRDNAIIVGVGETAGWAEVTVTDGCGGTPPAELARLLSLESERPNPLDARGRPGLGLVIARGLIAAHGGEILVENREPGCVFRIRLPLPPPERRSDSPHPTPS